MSWDEQGGICNDGTEENDDLTLKHHPENIYVNLTDLNINDSVQQENITRQCCTNLLKCADVTGPTHCCDGDNCDLNYLKTYCTQEDDGTNNCGLGPDATHSDPSDMRIDQNVCCESLTTPNPHSWQEPVANTDSRAGDAGDGHFLQDVQYRGKTCRELSDEIKSGENGHSISFSDYDQNRDENNGCGSFRTYDSEDSTDNREICLGFNDNQNINDGKCNNDKLSQELFFELCCNDIQCSTPDNTDGYEITENELDRTLGVGDDYSRDSFDVDVSCLEHYEGTPVVSACSSSGNYTLSGCTPIICDSKLNMMEIALYLDMLLQKIN